MRILKVKNITLVTKTVTSDSNPDLIDEMKKSGLTLKQVCQLSLIHMHVSHLTPCLLYTSDAADE